MLKGCRPGKRAVLEAESIPLSQNHQPTQEEFGARSPGRDGKQKGYGHAEACP
jgi:hypothetical protein